MGVIVEEIPRGCQGLFTPVSLGYPLSVFNKDSTLNPWDTHYQFSIKALLLKLQFKLHISIEPATASFQQFNYSGPPPGTPNF